MSLLEEIDVSERKACCSHLRVSYRTRRSNGGGVSGFWRCDACESEFVPAVVARKAEERAETARDYNKSLFARAEAAEASVRKLEVRGSCDHVFESNTGMFDTMHRYCTKCGRAE